MKRKQIFSVTVVGILSLLLIAGIAVAATEWPGDNTFTGIVNFFPNGIRIGQQGTGGVTYFNGTIANITTTDGRDNPVTVGDNLRVDGRIQRGHNLPSDGWNVIIDDGLEINKTLLVEGEATMKGLVKFQGGTDPAFYSKTEADNMFVKKENPVYETQYRDLFLNYSNIFPEDESITYDVRTATPFGLSIQANKKFYLPLNLPSPGVEIQATRLYAYDSSGFGNFTLKLYKEVAGAPGIPTITELASMSTSGSSGAQSVDDTLTPFEVVNSTTTSYRFVLESNAADGLGGQALRFYGVRVTYGLTRPN